MILLSTIKYRRDDTHKCVIHIVYTLFNHKALINYNNLK